ncbi:hypothetical protein [Tenacibaculum maritimum]|uniref:hypothetical protein n=1 Tax=Tenacibaculum maritimum TaxID=107401 RepID=UPI003876F985
MNIIQHKNGSINITNTLGTILYAFPFVFIQKHPRIHGAILLTSHLDFKNEKEGVSLLAQNIRKINDVSFNPYTDDLINVILENIQINGASTNLPTEKKVATIDWVAFWKLKEWEETLIFFKENKTAVIDNMKNNLSEFTYVIQFQKTQIQFSQPYDSLHLKLTYGYVTVDKKKRSRIYLQVFRHHEGGFRDREVNLFSKQNKEFTYNSDGSTTIKYN